MDSRIPPTQNHLSGLQANRFKGWILTASQYLKGFLRLRLVPQDDNQFSVGESGFQVTSTNPRPQYVSSGGTAQNLAVATGQTFAFSATPAFTLTAGNVIRIILTANITSWTVSNGTWDGQLLVFKFVQDGTGTRTLAAPPANVRWAGSALTLTATAAKIDQLTLIWDATLSVWLEAARSLNM